MLKPTEAIDFGDDLFLLDFSDEAPEESNPPTNPNPSRRNATVDKLPGLPPPEEEEELEWLSNKDAFPALETSFDLSVHSWSSSSAASVDHRSPVSVLASALPFRAPARSRTKGQRRRRKPLPFFTPSVFPAAPFVDGKGKRKCKHCESEETPQWRAGPDGPKTLCNACGVRFKSGRLVPEYRPANSPTYSAAVHSNSHRRVVEMRRKKYGMEVSGGTAAAGSGGHRRGFGDELAVV